MPLLAIAAMLARPFCAGVSLPAPAVVSTAGVGHAPVVGCATGARLVCHAPYSAHPVPPILVTGATLTVSGTSATREGNCTLETDQGDVELVVVQR